jgi:hypothetical protein|tara:strand:+ start:276 stop:695 length:420 start_codon:yes stop_codon:yes gene_type:complete
MAVLKGDVGKIMFENAGGTEADIAATRSWSLSVTKDSHETTKQGDTSKSFIGGLISGEGSVELLYDDAGNSDYQAFIDDVLVTGDAGDALFELFPNSSTSAKKISFAGIITGAEYGATLGETQVINVSFITNGAITSAI